MRTIHVGLIGFGLGGRVFHAPMIHAVPGLKLAAIVERSGDTARVIYPGPAFSAQRNAGIVCEGWLRPARGRPQTRRDTRPAQLGPGTGRKLGHDVCGGRRRNHADAHSNRDRRLSPLLRERPRRDRVRRAAGRFPATRARHHAGAGVGNRKQPTRMQTFLYPWWEMNSAAWSSDSLVIAGSGADDRT